MATTKSPPRRLLSRAPKVTAIVVSTIAALGSILSFARSYGIVGDSDSPHLTVGDFEVAWVGVLPSADTATAIGDTIHLAATMTDRRGRVLVGATLVWSSAEPGVASVDSTGTVVARGPGTATIVATAGEHTARSRITVRQHVASVRIGDAGPLHLREGESRSIDARALDRRGYVIVGRRPTWRSSDTTLATVDSGGVATGVNPGRVTLSARVDSVSDDAAVDVVATADSIALLAGAEQRAPAGRPVAEPVVVRVLSRRGKPVPGATVHFGGVNGQGAFEPAVASTNNDGRARTVWTLGDAPGRQRVLVTVDGFDGSLDAVAEADPVAANTRVAAVGESPSATAGAKLAEPVAVRVTDTLGRAVADVPVAWAALGGGTLTAAAARTDSAGEARAEWTLGPRAGTQRARVTVGSGRGVPPFILEATANAGAPAAATIASGDAQTAVVGSTLKKPVVIRVADAHGNPVADVRVTLATSSDGVTDSVLATDAAGTASTRWTLGRSAGAQTLRVRVDGVPRVLQLTARARHAAAANIVFDAPPAAGTVGRPLGRPLTVSVSDAYGNAVANAPVVFAARAGSAAPRKIVTDARGRARTEWRLGTRAGEQSLVVTVAGTDARSELVVEAKAARSAARAASVHAPKKRGR